MKQYQREKYLEHCPRRPQRRGERPPLQRPCSIFPAPRSAEARSRRETPCATTIPRKSGARPPSSAAVAPLEWKNHKINLLDAPGLFDFEGGLCEAVRAADSVLIAVSGKDGVAVGTEKAFAAASARRPGEDLLRQRPVRRERPLLPGVRGPEGQVRPLHLPGGGALHRGRHRRTSMSISWNTRPTITPAASPLR